MCAMSISSFTR